MKKWFVLTLLCFTTNAFTSGNEWEFLGPDTTGHTSNITALYSFGNGYLIAGKSPDIQSNSGKTFMRSYNHGTTWDTAHTGLPVMKEVRRFMFHKGRLWAGVMSNYPSLYYSNDTGKTWIGAGPDGNPGFYPFAYTYCMEAKDSTIVVGAFNEWGRSTDMGKTWKSYNSNDIYGVQWGAVYCMLNFRDTLFIGTGFGVWASVDWGLNWERREGGSGIFGITLDTLGNKILLGTYSCASWFYNHKPPLGLNVLFSYYPSVTEAFTINRKDIYVYSTYGYSCVTFYSKDTGTTWNRFYLRPGDSTVYVNLFYNDEKYVFAGTQKGLYRKFLDETAITKLEQNKASQIPIYLTPYAIILVLPQTTLIRIQIFTLKGNLIYSIETTAQQFTFPLGKLIKASGVYCIKISAGNIKVKKTLTFFTK